MKKIANVTSLVFIVIALIFGGMALRFPPGANGAVGPGYFPIIMCVLVISLSILQILLSKHSYCPPEQLELKLFRKENNIVWITMALTLLYTIAIKEIGFVSSSLLFMLGINFYFKVQERSKVVAVTLPFIVVAVLWYVFTKLLLVQLPRGIFI